MPLIFHFSDFRSLSPRRVSYMCGDYNVDLLKVYNTHFYDHYFDNILYARYIPKIALLTRQGWQFLPLSGNFRKELRKKRWKKLRKKWKGRNTIFRGRNGRNEIKP